MLTTFAFAKLHGIPLPADAPVYDVKFSRRLKRTAGYIYYGKKLILLNPVLQKNAEAMRNTFLHEVAHAIAWDKFRHNGHGLVWYRIAKDIGCDGRRTHSISEIYDALRVTATCRRCGRKWKMARAARGPRVHTECGGEVVYTKRLTAVEQIINNPGDLS